MKHLVGIACILLLTSGCVLKKKSSVNRVVMDEKAGQKVLLGKCNKSGFMNEEFKGWYDTNYVAYEPDLAIVDQFDLQSKMGLEVLLVFGTWCSDSRREVPHFFRILEQVDFNLSTLNMYGVDRNKKAPDIDTEKLKIERVPTFIFYKKGTEIGRIVETPQETLELDMFNILQQY